MLFEGRYKTQDYFRYFLYLFSVPSFIFSINERVLIPVYPQKNKMNYYLYSKDGFNYCHSIQYKMLLFVYIYIDLLKLKACKLFENSDADLSWLIFLKKPTCFYSLLRSAVGSGHIACLLVPGLLVQKPVRPWVCLFVLY